MRFYGTSWALSENNSEHAGLLGDAKLGKHWYLRAGLFRSTYNVPRYFGDLYLNTNSAGIADHVVLAEPRQSYGSTSGEIQLSQRLEHQEWSQEVTFGVRGRSVSAQYGGAATFEFGVGLPENTPSVTPPRFSFGATSTDQIHDYSSGASYTFRWKKRLNFTAAVRRETYSNENDDPVSGHSVKSSKPWLYNSSIAFSPINEIVLFGTLTRGLEDSGTAPSSAVNRGEVLNATRSSQEEVGLKYSPAPSLTFLASAFDVQKTYFAPNANGVFSDLGQERHRGIELSFSGQLTSQLRIVSGVLVMSPEVTAVSRPMRVKMVAASVMRQSAFCERRFEPR